VDAVWTVPRTTASGSPSYVVGACEPQPTEAPAARTRRTRAIRVGLMMVRTATPLAGHENRLPADDFVRGLPRPRQVSTSIRAPSARSVPMNFGKLVAMQSQSSIRLGPLAASASTADVIAIR